MFPKILTLKKTHLALTLAALGAMLLWIFAWVFIGVLSGEDGEAMKGLLAPLGPLSPPPSATAGVLGFLYGVVQACLLAPICEEMFFRWSFCSIAYDAQGKARANWSLPLVVMTAGLLFGASHGFRYGFSYEMVIRMGMLGGILALLWVMLKRRGASALVALCCCVFAHGAYNFAMTATQATAMRAASQGYQKGVEETAEGCKQFIIQAIAEGKLAVPGASKSTPAPSAE